MSTEGIATETTVSPTETTEPEQTADQAVEVEGEEQAEPVEAKPEKTAEQRKIASLQKGIDRKHRQLFETRELLDMARAQLGLTRHDAGDNIPQASDSETVTLSRADAQKLIESEARKLAPTIAKEQSEHEHRAVATAKLRASLGDQFQELTDELAEVFTRERQFDVLQAENPAALIRYLTADENADEAEAIGRMSQFDAGRAIAKLESKLKTPKPQPSKVPAPLEQVRGAGNTAKSLFDLPYDEYVKRRNANHRR